MRAYIAHGSLVEPHLVLTNVCIVNPPALICAVFSALNKLSALLVCKLSTNVGCVDVVVNVISNVVTSIL